MLFIPSFSSIIAENSSVKKCLLKALFCDSYTNNFHYHGAMEEHTIIFEFSSNTSKIEEA